MGIYYGLKECAKCEYNVRCQECVYNKKDISKLIAETRADTVRKMQEKLHARKVSYGNITFRVVPLDDIDQIAKEMLEGEKQ